MSSILKNEFKGWKPWEVLWLAFVTVTVIIAGIICNDDMINLVSSTTGVIAFVLLGKGKLSTYIFGAINAFLYGIISYKYKLYGETALNLLYYVPMEIYGFFSWKKNMSVDNHEVLREKMNVKQKWFAAIALIAGTAIYGGLLMIFDNAMPFLDAFIVVSLVIALFMSVKRFCEQWWLWIVGDIAAVALWAINFAESQNNISTMLMWGVALVNDFIMMYKWHCEEKKQNN